MRILIVRHGEAGDWETFARSGRPDSQRPLTALGRKRVWLAAHGLAAQVPVLDVLATSPYARALQTAEILAKAYGDIAIKQIPALEPDAPLGPLINWLATQSSVGCVALVGHSPDLPRLITHLICQHARPLLKLKKGGACLVSFSRDAALGDGVLRWLMDAAQLGKLVG
jgi:phosphohistidine phosphatase